MNKKTITTEVIFFVKEAGEIMEERTYPVRGERLGQGKGGGAEAIVRTRTLILGGKGSRQTLSRPNF